MTTPLFALANTLINGVLTLESVYAKNGSSFPSLDEPFVPNALDNDAVLAATTRLIVGAAAQIIATVRPPVETLQDYALSMYTPATLGLAVDCNFADVLESVGPKGLHSRDIAQKVGLDEEKTAHVLRYLATRHVFREVAPNVFASNRLSSVLCKGSSIQSIKEDPANHYEGAPVAASIAHFCDEGLKGSSAIASWVKDPKGYTAPVNMAFDTKLLLFEWFEQPGNEWRIQRFTAAMKGATSRFKLESFTSALGRLSLKPDDVVVDVGGNVGMLSLNMLTAYPHLRFVVQDLPNVILGAEQYWRTNNPEALAEKRVTLQAHSFFDLQPVQNAAVYFMRAILHDWPTPDCITILKNIRQAAGPTSKLLVFEHILPLACAETSTEFDVTDDTIPPAPWPMLPNLGVGLGAWVTALDMQMMNLLDGQERTIAQFAELGAATGWKLESVKPGGMAAFIYSAA